MTKSAYASISSLAADGPVQIEMFNSILGLETPTVTRSMHAEFVTVLVLFLDRLPASEPEPGTLASRFVCVNWGIVFARDLMWALSIVERSGNSFFTSLTRNFHELTAPFIALIHVPPFFWVSPSCYSRV